VNSYLLYYAGTSPTLAEFKIYRHQILRIEFQMTMAPNLVVGIKCFSPRYDAPAWSRGQMTQAG